MREGAKIRTARGLRRTMTDAERAVWRRLKARTLNGAKFRRQHTIGPYVADFACLERQLVIEIDGGQHARQLEADAARTEFFRKQGFRVLRFWNGDVFSNIDGVLTAIMEALASPHPGPLPQAGEGGQRRNLTLSRLRERVAPKAPGEGTAANDSSGEP